MRLKFALFLSGLLFASPLAAQDSLVVKLTPADSSDYYPWIERLLAAPTDWRSDSADESIAGTRWRFVVTRSEIYVSITLERVSLGEEGCCMRLVAARDIDIERVARHFRLRGEISRLDDLVALGPNTFRFRLQDTLFRLSITSPESAVFIREGQRAP